MIEIAKTVNLDAPIRPEDLYGVTFSAENKAHRFIITCQRNSADITLTGIVTAKLIRADGKTILMQGSINTGKAVVDLHQDCYNVSGRFQLAIFNIASGTTTCIYACVGNVYPSQSSTLVDSGDVIPSVEEIAGAQATMISNVNTAIGNADAATTRANQAAETAENFTGLVAPTYSTSATYAVGNYVVYNGAMYRCITSIDTAEAWTAAHWTTAPLANEVTDLKSALSNTDVITKNNSIRFLINEKNLEKKTVVVDSSDTHGYHLADSNNYVLTDEIDFDEYNAGVYKPVFASGANNYISVLVLDVNGDYVSFGGNYPGIYSVALPRKGKFRVRISTTDVDFAFKNQLMFFPYQEEGIRTQVRERVVGDFINDLIKNRINKFPGDLSIWRHETYGTDGKYNVSANVMSSGLIPFHYNKFKVISPNNSVRVTLLDENFDYIYMAQVANSTQSFDVRNRAYYAKPAYVIYSVVKTNIAYDDVHSANVQVIPDVDETPLKLKVMSYNVGWYRYGESVLPTNGWNQETGPDNLKNLIRLFADEKCDILGLQEDTTYAGPNNTYDLYNDLYSIMYKNKLTVLTELRIASNINSVGCYIVSPSSGSSFRCELFNYSGKEFLFVDAHLSGNQSDRASEISAIVTEMNKYYYSILTMDSNIADITELTPFTSAGYKIGNGGFFGTFNTIASNYPFDNIIVSGTINIMDFKVISDRQNVLTSDHYPVVADLVLL